MDFILGSFIKYKKFTKHFLLVLIEDLTCLIVVETYKHNL